MNSPVSLHHRRQYEERSGIDRDSEEDHHREPGRGDHQYAAQGLGVLVHSRRVPGEGWALTDALVIARSAHG